MRGNPSSQAGERMMGEYRLLVQLADPEDEVHAKVRLGDAFSSYGKY